MPNDALQSAPLTYCAAGANLKTVFSVQSEALFAGFIPNTVAAFPVRLTYICRQIISLLETERCIIHYSKAWLDFPKTLRLSKLTGRFIRFARPRVSDAVIVGARSRNDPP